MVVQDHQLQRLAKVPHRHDPLEPHDAADHKGQEHGADARARAVKKRSKHRVVLDLLRVYLVHGVHQPGQKDQHPRRDANAYRLVFHVVVAQKRSLQGAQGAAERNDVRRDIVRNERRYVD